uniref:Uncharacterized protein n=1 Tax=Heterorhabditis bacteriophora TaxID=37862 RepID=A0A1I7WKJ8_HETBA
MSYEVRRFPKGLRNFAAPYLINTKHRKKPPSRFFRRRSRNLLLVFNGDIGCQIEVFNVHIGHAIGIQSDTVLELYRLAIWIHPSCRDEVFEHLAALLNLEKTKCDYVEDKTECPTSVEEWRLSKMNVHTDIYKGKNGIEVNFLIQMKEFLLNKYNILKY